MHESGVQFPVWTKTFRKNESKLFLFWYCKRPKISFRNKTFLFIKIESWNCQVQFEIEFHETSQNLNSIRQPIKKDKNNNCLNKLNELKFYEVSRNSISNFLFWTMYIYSIKRNDEIRNFQWAASASLSQSR